MKFRRFLLAFLITAVALALPFLTTNSILNLTAGAQEGTIQMGSTYTCAENNSQFKILSCDARDMCRVFTVNKFSPGGGEVVNQSKDTTLAVIRSNRCKPDGPGAAGDNKNDSPRMNTEPLADKPAEAPSAEGPTGSGGPSYGFEYNVLYGCRKSDEKAKVLSCGADGWCQVFVPNKYRADGGETQRWRKGAVLDWIERFTCSPEGKPLPPAKGCSTDPEVNSERGPGESTALSLKRAILTDYQKRNKEYKVGVRFETFQIGAPYSNQPNSMGTVNAPVGTKVYPVKTKLSLCTLFGNGDVRREVGEAVYTCYKNAFGEWGCGGGSAHLKTEWERNRN